MQIEWYVVLFFIIILTSSWTNSGKALVWHDLQKKCEVKQKQLPNLVNFRIICSSWKQSKYWKSSLTIYECNNNNKKSGKTQCQSLGFCDLEGNHVLTYCLKSFKNKERIQIYTNIFLLYSFSTILSICLFKYIASPPKTVVSVEIVIYLPCASSLRL